MVSMNAVVSHCTVRAETPRSTINRGSATLMIVSFKITTKAATRRIAMTWRSRAGSGCEAPWPKGLGASWLVVVVTRTILTFIDTAYGDCVVRNARRHCHTQGQTHGCGQTHRHRRRRTQSPAN